MLYLWLDLKSASLIYVYPTGVVVITQMLFEKKIGKVRVGLLLLALGKMEQNELFSSIPHHLEDETCGEIPVEEIKKQEVSTRITHGT